MLDNIYLGTWQKAVKLLNVEHVAIQKFKESADRPGGDQALSGPSCVVKCVASGKSQQCVWVANPCLPCLTRSGTFHVAIKCLLLKAYVNSEACLNNMMAWCVAKVICHAQLSMIKTEKGATNLINKAIFV